MSKLLIKNGTLVTMNRSRDVLTGDLFIEGSKIKAIGSTTLPADELADEIIDATDCWVLPGFIQTHIHLCQTLFRNQAEDLELLDWLQKKIWPMEGEHTPETLRRSAELGVAELLKGGTTTILDMGSVHHTDSIFEVCEKAGIRAFCGKAMMDEGENIPTSLQESSEESLQESLRLMEKWHGKSDGRLHYAFAPRFALSCSKKLLKEISDLSSKKNIIVHTHASENRSEVKAVETKMGVSNIQYFHDLGLSGARVCLAHCIWLSDNDLKILSDTGTHVLHCPSSNLKLGSGIAKVPEMLAAGINVTLGADGAPCNNNLDMFMEMRLAGLIQKPRKGVTALPAQKIVEMATINGAKALGIGDHVGSLETGKLADIILVRKNSVHSVPNGDPYTTLVYATHSSDVQTVIVNGKTVVKDGGLT